MPELPEVETTVRLLRDKWVDKVVKDVVIQPRGERHFNFDKRTIEDKLIGARLKTITRTGKWIKLQFEKENNDIAAVAHLRMSGRFLSHQEPLTSAHESFRFLLHDTTVVSYIDQRRFGTFHVVDDFSRYPSLQNLGPDALSAEFTSEHLAAKLKNMTKPIYSALLDQSVVAGLGNIYVNESLHAAGIHPLQPANQLPSEKLDLLVSEINRILSIALEFKGTTLLDGLYSTPEGTEGGFYNLLKVYGRKKDPDVAVLKVGGRSVFVHRSTHLNSL